MKKGFTQVSVLLLLLNFVYVTAKSQTKSIDSMTRIIKTLKEDTVKVNKLLGLSYLFANASKFIEAKESVEESARLAGKLRYKIGSAMSYRMLSSIFFLQNNTSERMKHLDTALSIIDEVIKESNDEKEKTQAKKIKAGIYNDRGVTYRMQGKGAESLKDFNTSIEIWKSVDDKEGQAFAYLGLARTYFFVESDTAETSKNYGRAIKLFEEMGNKKMMVDCYKWIGNMHSGQDNQPEALKNFYTALKFAESINDKNQMQYLLHAMGAAYFFLENYTESIKNLLEALKLARETDDTLNIARVYIMMGDSYQKVNMNEGLKAYDRGFEMLSKLKPIPMEEARIHNGIAEIYEMVGDSLLFAGNEKEAEKKFHEAIEKHKVGLKLRGEACDPCASESLTNIGSLSMKLKRYHEARIYVTKGLKLADSARLKLTRVKAYNILAKLDSIDGNFKSALENYQKYIIYRDSLISIESKKKAESAKLQFEFDKKEEVLKKQQTLTQSKLESQKKQKNFYLGGAVLLILLSLFAFLNFRNQKKISRLQTDSYAKEKAELELQSLRAQLNPHFMFNSLNAIQELILLEENEKSQSYLARFAKLLRMLLENADKPFISLQREIDFLQLYLALENLRIPDLQFSIEIDEGIDTEKTTIPNMVLQPYIENAIWHGLSHKENNRRLQIRINTQNGVTKYEIEDNGVGRKKAAELKSLYRKEHKSKGMELLSKRFKLLAKEYGSEIRTSFTDIHSGQATGTIVTITVPDNFKTK